MSQLLTELTQKKNLINELAQRFGARRIRVFGSVAKGKESPDSDVDFLVDFPRGYDLFKQRLALAEKLQSIGREIDLIPEHEVNRHIEDQIFREAIDL